LVFLVINFIPT